MTNPDSPIHRPAHSLDELMGLNDSAFIYCAYWTVLGRGCDPQGHHHFRGRLRSGISKAQILWDLSHSPEGRQRALKLPGLATLLERHRRVNWPLIGPIFARRYGMESQSSRARSRRMLVHMIQAVEHDLGERLEQLEGETEKQKRIERLESRIETLENAVPADGGRPLSLPPAHARQVVTSRARHLLGALTTALAQGA